MTAISKPASEVSSIRGLQNCCKDLVQLAFYSHWMILRQIEDPIGSAIQSGCDHCAMYCKPLGGPLHAGGTLLSFCFPKWLSICSQKPWRSLGSLLKCISRRAAGGFGTCHIIIVAQVTARGGRYAL